MTKYKSGDLVIVRTRDMERGDVVTVGVVNYVDSLGRYSVWVMLPDRYNGVQSGIYQSVSWGLRENEIAAKVGEYIAIPIVEEEDDDI